MDDYDDEYYDDDERDTGAPRGRSYGRRGERFDDTYAGGRYDGRDYDDPRGDYDAPPTGGFRYADEPRYRPREFDDMPRPSWFGSLRGSTRGALAMDPRRMAELFPPAARCRRSPRCGPRTTARPAPSASASATASR